MDPISITSGIANLVGVMEKVLRAARDLATQVREAEREIGEVVGELDVFRTLLTTLDKRPLEMLIGLPLVHREALSEAITTSMALSKKLLSVLEPIQRSPSLLFRHIALVRSTQTLELARKCIREQRFNIQVMLRQVLLPRSSPERGLIEAHSLLPILMEHRPDRATNSSGHYHPSIPPDVDVLVSGGLGCTGSDANLFQKLVVGYNVERFSKASWNMSTTSRLLGGGIDTASNGNGKQRDTVERGPTTDSGGINLLSGNGFEQRNSKQVDQCSGISNLPLHGREPHGPEIGHLGNGIMHSASEASRRQPGSGSHVAARVPGDVCGHPSRRKRRAAIPTGINCFFSGSRCVEAGLVVLGAAGAGTMGSWGPAQGVDAWVLGSTVSIPTLHTCYWRPASLHRLKISNAVLFERLLSPSMLASPATLITGIGVTTLALTTYHYLHRHEKYQDPLILGVAGGGALVGRLAGLDGTAVLLRVVPWCVLVSLLLSTAYAARKRKVHQALIHEDKALWLEAEGPWAG